MWGELVTPLTIDSRIWPRTLAIGERFWASKNIRNIKDMYRRMFLQSYHLEELGINHIRNIDVILRNISENQNIEYLKKLTRIYEPVKYYTRNKGGTEYQSYSPYTLFADACSADAKDALEFNFLVDEYLSTKNKKILDKIMNNYLKVWKDYYTNFMNLGLKPNPKLKKIFLLSENLSNAGNLLLQLLMNHKPDKTIIEKLAIEIKKMDTLAIETDVEPAVKKSFIKLLNSIK